MCVCLVKVAVNGDYDGPVWLSEDKEIANASGRAVLRRPGNMLGRSNINIIIRDIQEENVLKM